MATRTRGAAGAGAALALLAAAAARAEADGVAAYVTSNVITVGEVRAAAASFQAGQGGSQNASVYRQVLTNLVERYLILAAYDQQKGKIADWAFEERIAAVIEKRYAGDRDRLRADLEREGLMEDDWRRELRKILTINVMRDEYVESKVRVSPAEARNRYDADPKRYTKRDVHLRMIVLPTLDEKGDLLPSARERAEKVLQRLRAGEDFAAVARAESSGSEAARGGDFGWMDEERMHPRLAKAVAGLKPGAVSGLVTKGSDIYILKVEERKEKIPTFEETQKRIAAEVRDEHEERLHRRWIEQLRREHYVRILDVDFGS